MRRFLGRFILIPVASFGLLLAGCQAPAPKDAKAAATTGVDPVSVVGGYMAAWNAHNAEKAASYMTDDVVYYDVTIGVPQVSRDSARKNVIQAFLAAVPDCQWVRDTTPPIIGQDGVAFQWTFTGTQTGAFLDGTPATGKKFSFKGATLIRLRGDKIAFQSDYYDAYGFFKQLGLAK
jgi:steroid delta-isomerase-like uncharacterized protein